MLFLAPVLLEALRFLDEVVFVRPSSARCLLTVAAAIDFARFVLRPCFRSLSLMCSY
jgi:hypothetical protein